MYNHINSMQCDLPPWLRNNNIPDVYVPGLVSVGNPDFELKKINPIPIRTKKNPTRQPSSNNNNASIENKLHSGFKAGDYMSDEELQKTLFDMHIVDQKKIKNSQSGGIFDNDRKQIDELNELADIFESATFDAVIPTYKPRKEEDNGPIVALNDIYNYDIAELDEDLYDDQYDPTIQGNIVPPNQSLDHKHYEDQI